MSLQNRTQNERHTLANLLDRASAAVRQNIHRNPVHDTVAVEAALAALKVSLDATVADAVSAGGG